MSGPLGNYSVALFGKVTLLRTDLDAHSGDVTGNVHGAVSAATVNMIVRRDASGRADIVAPAAADSTTKIPTTAWVQGEISGAGTVTSVGTGIGLTGGPITGAGTIDLANTAVVAASYTAANITVDAQGRLTSASNGTVVNTVFGRSGAVSAATGDYAAFYPQLVSPETISGAWTYSGSNIHSAGSLRFNDNIPINFGTGTDARLDYDSASNDLELLLNGTTNFEVIADSTRVRFTVSNGATGGVTIGYGIESSGGLSTGDPGASGNLTGARTHNQSQVLRPVGLGVWEHTNIGASTNTARTMFHRRLRNVSGTAIALTVIQDSTVPDGAWILIQATSSAMTIVQGSE